MVMLHLPTISRFTVKTDVADLPDSQLQVFIQQLNDLLNEIDQNYTEKAIRGRMVHGKFKRVYVVIEPGKGEHRNRRFLVFSPYPSHYLNEVRILARDFYGARGAKGIKGIIGELALTIQMLGSTKVYLLPFARAYDFLYFMDQKQHTVATLNTDTGDFQDSKDFQRIKSLFDDNGIKLDQSRLSDLDPIKVDFIKIQINPAADVELIEQRWKESYGEMNTEGLDRVRKQLENQKYDMVVLAINSIYDQLQLILKGLSGEVKLKKIKPRLKTLRLLAIDLGLKALADVVITPIVNVADNPTPEKVMQEFGTYYLEKGVSQRVMSFLKKLQKSDKK